LPTNWNQFVNLKPQNKIVAVCLLILGVGATAVMATWGVRKMQMRFSQNFIEIFEKLGDLPILKIVYELK